MQILPDDVAHRLSTRLDAAARMLDAAHDPEDFAAALDVNGRVWREVYAAAPSFDWPVTERMVEFSLSMQGRRGVGVDDDKVEALISMNRRLSRAIADNMRLAVRAQHAGSTLWLDWLDRCFKTASH